jgi:DNA-directed RNA polymerase specialized sigma subunit
MTAPKKVISIFSSPEPATVSTQSPSVTEQTAFAAWKARPGPETSAQFLKAVDPVINTAVFSYGGAGRNPQLKSQAKLMALQAMKTYVPEQGTIKTYLLSQLQGLRRVAGKSQQLISVPEKVVLQRAHLQSAENELEDSLGRPASDAELSDYLGLSRKRLAYIRRAAPGVVSGSLMDNEGQAYDPVVKLPGGDEGEDAWEDFVYGDLDKVNKLIMDMTLGRNGRTPTTTSQIATKLGLTPSAVSQRKAKIQAMLSARETAGLF